jgi:hypothetical protein
MVSIIASVSLIEIHETLTNKTGIYSPSSLSMRYTTAIEFAQHIDNEKPPDVTISGAKAEGT